MGELQESRDVVAPGGPLDLEGKKVIRRGHFGWSRMWKSLKSLGFEEEGCFRME